MGMDENERQKRVPPWVEHPDSQSLADKLNAESATLCVHDRDPCYMRCGVQRQYRSHWEVIPYSRRLEWCEAVYGDEALQRDAQYVRKFR